MGTSLTSALGCVLALSAVGIGASIGSSMFAGAANAAITGTGQAIATPAFDGSGGSPITSYFRFFNGGSAATTFSISIVGSQTGQLYGTSFTIQIPSHASPQYSLGQLLVLAGTSGAGAGVSKGDTSFALFMTDPDVSSGYQHVTYNGTTTLFENNSVCNNGLLSAAYLNSTSQNVLTNVHTSRLGGYPSVIYLFNSSNAAVTVPVIVYDAGLVGSDGKTLSGTSGNSLGSSPVTIPANTTVTKNFTDLQTAVNWTPSSTQLHANVVVVPPSGSSTNPVILAHSIFNATLGGSINMTSACSVNALSSSSGGGGGGSGGSGGSSSATALITNGSAGTTYPLSSGQTFSAITVTNGAAIEAGTATVPTGSVAAGASGSIVATAKGFNFTLPDGKTVNFDLSAGAADNFGGDFETLTTDGTRDVDVKLQNGQTPALSYSTFATWTESDSAKTPLSTGSFAAGIATTAAQMPTTGTATYTGDITGFGWNATTAGNIKGGTVSLSVNFATKAITGSVTNIVTKGLGGGDNGPTGTMNGMNLTGSISGNTFTITATAATAAAGTTINITGATATFGGTFSGPSANELAAASTMTGGATIMNVAFGAHQ